MQQESFIRNNDFFKLILFNINYLLLIKIINVNVMVLILSGILFPVWKASIYCIHLVDKFPIYSQDKNISTEQIPRQKLMAHYIKLPWQGNVEQTKPQDKNAKKRIICCLPNKRILTKIELSLILGYMFCFTMTMTVLHSFFPLFLQPC